MMGEGGGEEGGRRIPDGPGRFLPSPVPNNQ